MDSYANYVLSTVSYGIVAIMALIGAIHFYQQGRMELFLIGLAMVCVAVDNFFCGSRAKSFGVKATGHYIVPPFLRP